MKKIVVRNTHVYHAHVNSAYIYLTQGMNYHTTGSLISKFGLGVLLKELYHDELDQYPMEKSQLFHDYIQVSRHNKANDYFFETFDLDGQYAVSIQQGHINLHRLVEKTNEPYTELVPWYYQSDEQYLGDAWYFCTEEILFDIGKLPMIEFFKKYKGF